MAKKFYNLKKSEWVGVCLCALFIFSVLEIFILPSFESDECSLEPEIVEVRGTSMQGIVGDAEKVRIHRNYYRCHLPKKGDLVVATLGENSSTALLKKVYATEGDEIEYQIVQGRMLLFVDKKPLLNEQGHVYAFPLLTSLVLRDELRLHEGVIPPNHVLILGNVPKGSIDSSKFGVLPVQSLHAKAELLK